MGDDIDGAAESMARLKISEPPQLPAAGQTSSPPPQERFEAVLQAFAASAAFGAQTGDFSKGAAAFTFPEDAFLADPRLPEQVRLYQSQGHFDVKASEFWKKLPEDFSEVLSPSMYSWKKNTGDAGHCKHVNHMFLFLARSAGGARLGTESSTSAPYFDSSLTQSFDHLLPPDQRGRRMKMPREIRDLYEPRGWKQFGTFVRELDGFFAPRGARDKTEGRTKTSEVADDAKPARVPGAPAGATNTPAQTAKVDIKQDIRAAALAAAKARSKAKAAGKAQPVQEDEKEGTKNAAVEDAEEVARRDKIEHLSVGNAVLVHGIESQPELNGCVGVIEDINDGKNRYTLKIVFEASASVPGGDGKTKPSFAPPGRASGARPSVHLKNLELPVPFGTRVLVKELVGKPEFNGRNGIVRGFLPDKNRYRVELDHVETVEEEEKTDSGKINKPVLLAKTLSLMAKNFERVFGDEQQGDFCKKMHNPTTPASPAEEWFVDVLSLDLDLSSGYNVGGSTGHGMLIFKLYKVDKDRQTDDSESPTFRIVHAFAGRFSLAEWMRQSKWLSEEEAGEYLEALKAAAFSGAGEKEKARKGFEKLFEVEAGEASTGKVVRADGGCSSASGGKTKGKKTLIAAAFHDSQWALRKDFTEGQSLSKVEMRKIRLERLLFVMEGFLNRFERMTQESGVAAGR
eukprot:CAMPEP_0178987962 /NCGR_PEP_ID=MMETSP0795-20121207/3557_1 /TAXON_ID=88552 /ORGANISM="Amoebophrya sp., Strain Ameob2" /LENGTH=683 /DNA_ID=CAMNT_0020679205 /DNA_START=157 /DNA_END=2207 /DNA_ORIENTATION=+